MPKMFLFMSKLVTGIWFLKDGFSERIFGLSSFRFFMFLFSVLWWILESQTLRRSELRRCEAGYSFEFEMEKFTHHVLCGLSDVVLGEICFSKTNQCTQPLAPRRWPHWSASTSRQRSTPSTTMYMLAVSSRSSVLAMLLPPRLSAVRPSWRTLVCFNTVRLRSTTGLSVLWPLMFTAYAWPVGELIESYGMSYHQFTDVTQLLVSMDSTDATPAIDRLAHCSAAVRLWFLQNGLQLNGDKSEVVFLGTAAQLRSTANITTVDVTGSTLPVAPQLRSLGVTIDSNLRFDCHARNVVKACNFHTCALHHVRSLLIDDVAQTVACSIVASWLDYCNALLYGAPVTTFDKLQCTQNNMARVVCHCRGRTTPDRCLGRSIGFQWGSGSSTRWFYWLTSCGP